MDLNVSRKEQRLEPSGLFDVLVDNVFDVYPLYDTDDPNLITDVEIIDDPRLELLDRSMWAMVKQRGGDPLDINDGIQWVEYLIGEIPATACLLQVNAAVQNEGPGVKASYETIMQNGEEQVLFKLTLTNAV